MSARFTIVPDAYWDARRLVLAHAAEDPAIVTTRTPSATALAFAGSPSRVAIAEAGELACLRVVDGACVFHVDTEGDDESATHLEGFVRWLLGAVGPCRVFDDEDGSDLTWTADRTPASLFRPEPEFHA